MKLQIPRRRVLALGSASLAWPLATALPRRGMGQSPAFPRSTAAQGKRGVVASVHPLASAAAIEAFERGGNAIDAAVATSLMLSVVDGFNSGLGGGCLALVRRPSERAGGFEIQALDGRETAPAKASPEMFYRNGQPDPQLSQLGPLAAGVPGLLAALNQLSKTCGRLSWRSALEGAAFVADEGFELDENYVGRLRSAASRLKQFPSSAKVLLDPSGKPWPVGHRLRQPELAWTLRQVAEQGVEWFYEGEFAQRVGQFMQQEQGLMSESDLANYQVKLRSPVQCDYRHHSVFGFPPPSSGGIHIAQMLGMLQDYDVAEVFSESPALGQHLLIEVMKRAMADRAYWLGDADFAKVPRGLLDQDYLRERASSIDLRESSPVERHGQPPRADIDLFGRGGHTTHLTTADEEGHVVAITQTINTTFGNKMIVPGTGVVLNNELDDFSIAPGVRNAFGLLGSDANLIAPGKRPLSSMSPSIVLHTDGSPRMSCGAAGGPKIITAALQTMVRVLDLGYGIQEAIAAPRIHHQWSPDRVVCEAAMPEDIVSALRAMGHEVEIVRSAAVAQGEEFAADSLRAASDPRVPSSAMAW